MRRDVLAAALALVAFAGCHRGARTGVVSTTPAAQALVRAQELFRHGKFAQAQPLFRRVSFEMSPLDSLVPEASYFEAECYFQMGNPVEAAHIFRRVADEYANSRWAPLALLRAGDANADLWRRPVLDPAYGQAALATYQELIGRYPGTPAAARAQLRIRRVTEQLAEKQYLNGMFYLRRKFYDSAILYFKDLVALYPQSRRVPEALLKLVQIYRAVDYAEELQETCDHLRRFYPNTPGLEESCPAGASGSR